MLRTLLPPMACCWLLAAPASAQAPDPAEVVRLEQAERALVQALNDYRIGQGVAPAVWSEQLAVILREQCGKAIATGYEGGGAAPSDIGRAQKRALLHGLKTQIFDNYSTSAPDEFEASKVVAEQVAHPQIKQLDNGELRIAAAAVLRSAGGKWICLLALAKGGHENIEAVQKELAPEVEKLASADAATRTAACTALGARNSAESLPGLRAALRHADPATRLAAATALGQVRSRGIIPPLLIALHDGEAPVVQAAAASLSALTGRTDLGADAHKWEQWWEVALDSFQIPADGSAAKDTTRVGGEATGATVEELLSEWNDACKARDAIRKAAILEGLRDLPESEKNRKVEAVLKQGLGDSETSVRLEAIRGAARLKLKSTVPALMKLAEHTDAETARIALLGLAQIGELSALKVFTASAWDSKDPKVFATRVFAIRYMRHASSVDWIISLFTSGVGRGRRGGGGGGLAAARKVAFDSLEFLTGESFGNSIDPWQDWWKKRKSSFRPESLPDDYEVEGLFPRSRKDGGDGEGKKGRGRNGNE